MAIEIMSFPINKKNHSYVKLPECTLLWPQNYTGTPRNKAKDVALLGKLSFDSKICVSQTKTKLATDTDYVFLKHVIPSNKLT